MAQLEAVSHPTRISPVIRLLAFEMSETDIDIWTKWLLHRRDAGSPGLKRQSIEYLQPIRDRVLDNAQLEEGKTLLDVGCGDGLIAFGALERTQSGDVIFSDISQDLLDRCKELAEELRVIDRCTFVKAPADDLSALDDGSVSVVTTRSVLIYVESKAVALREFHRVLAPGGRFSLFEPINRFGYPAPDHMFSGYDVTPVADLARKVKDVYRQARPEYDDPMINFDERDLLLFAEEAGFAQVHLRLEVNIEPPSDEGDWEAFFHRAPNPLAPTLAEASSQSLSLVEAEKFIAHLRPLVESQRGRRKMAVAYLWGEKIGDG